MLGGLRFVLLGIGWWVLAEVIYRNARSRAGPTATSRGLWWLRVTAPLVALLFIGLGIWLWLDSRPGH